MDRSRMWCGHSAGFWITGEIRDPGGEYFSGNDGKKQESQCADPGGGRGMGCGAGGSHSGGKMGACAGQYDGPGMQPEGDYGRIQRSSVRAGFHFRNLVPPENVCKTHTRHLGKRDYILLGFGEGVNMQSRRNFHVYPADCGGCGMHAGKGSQAYQPGDQNAAAGVSPDLGYGKNQQGWGGLLTGKVFRRFEFH